MTFAQGTPVKFEQSTQVWQDSKFHHQKLVTRSVNSLKSNVQGRILGHTRSICRHDFYDKTLQSVRTIMLLFVRALLNIIRRLICSSVYMYVCFWKIEGDELNFKIVS